MPQALFSALCIFCSQAPNCGDWQHFSRKAVQHMWSLSLRAVNTEAFAVCMNIVVLSSQWCCTSKYIQDWAVRHFMA